MMRKGFNKFIQRSGLAEIKLLFIFLSVVVGLLIFVSIANEVVEGETQHFDNDILKSLREPNDLSRPAFPDWLTQAMEDITSLGSGTVLVLFTIIVTGYLLLQKKYYWLWLVLIATIGGALLVWGLKEFIGRTRPTVVTHLLEEKSLSFPSGHSMMSAIVYLTQATLLSKLEKNRKAKIYIISIALLLTFLIGISRIYIGVHYPTDVLAGWVAGISWALLCWYIASILQRRNQEIG
ncbi:MAG TPA: phosphatase PAP2 family protein [Ignavibacteriaceae bacterium]|nr:phosphatase PAP2 family protein [Ignavibacteriaceae bacterium]